VNTSPCFQIVILLLPVYQPFHCQVFQRGISNRKFYIQFPSLLTLYYVCMYVGMNVIKYVRMLVSMYVCVHVSMYKCMYLSIYKCIYV